MTPNTLTRRAQKALEVLSNGGRFVCRLEHNSYTGRTQYAYRLVKEGCVVKGIGFKTFHEIKDQFLVICNSTTSVSTYYRLKD